jgi:2-polyprenyl-3-methyl-5-hydroxy-6-metoxy-1,4-benzoquinol methylase
MTNPSPNPSPHPGPNPSPRPGPNPSPRPGPNPSPGSDDAATADRALKAAHRAMWARGDYPSVAADLIARLGPLLVQQSGVGPGQRVLDVAAGTGNASIPAALTGAEVVASDLTPELLEVGRALAAERGVEIGWREADAEQLPFDDGEFDVVLSVVGIMFAPHHQAAATSCSASAGRAARSG